MLDKINIYTDGSSIGNPGPGGYGIIIEWVGKSYVKELSDGYKLTTNNRMELLAVIIALESLKKKPMQVTIFSDSKYVIDSVEKKWIFEWEKKNFKGKKNSDLWRRFLGIYYDHILKFKWIRGHSNHPKNERCDQLAFNAAKGNNLKVDFIFEDLM